MDGWMDGSIELMPSTLLANVLYTSLDGVLFRIPGEERGYKKN